MTDIDNLAEIIPRKFSYTSITSENGSGTNSLINSHVVDFHTSTSSLVTTAINEIDENTPLFSNRKTYKNLFILSIAFLLLFTSYAGILSLQSSMNTKGNVGVNSLIVINVFILVSTFLFLSTIDK